jgi:hypothetical protein
VIPAAELDALAKIKKTIEMDVLWVPS